MLETGHLGPETPARIAKDHSAASNVPVVDSATPMPDDDSGSVAVVNLIRMLTRLGMKTTIAAMRERNSLDAGVAALAHILGLDHNVEAILTVAPLGA